jgi:hypothetical protein
MSYGSDSLMELRQAHPHQLLDEGKPFQLLAHPRLDAAFRAAKAPRTLRPAGGA